MHLSLQFFVQRKSIVIFGVQRIIEHPLIKYQVWCQREIVNTKKMNVNYGRTNRSITYIKRK